MNWSWIIEGVGYLAVLCSGGVAGWMWGSNLKALELVKLHGKVRRAHRLADRWEGDAGPSVNTTKAGPVWEQLRYELDLDEDEWPKDPSS